MKINRIPALAAVPPLVLATVLNSVPGTKTAGQAPSGR